MKNLIIYKFFPAIIIFFIFGTSISSASVKPSVIDYQNGMVSCSSNNISVVAFLKELADVSNIKIYILGRLQDSTLPVDFQQVPVTQVISRLLRGYSFALVYNRGSNVGGRIYFFDDTQSGDINDLQLSDNEPDDFNPPTLPAINDETRNPEQRRLVSKIAKLEADIASGNAEREYNFWIQKKDPVYVYNPWKDLEKSKEKLNALQQYGR
ncbi:hypothetical protein [uncultured Desulfobacter sp.]|uniref:hypothetical protein n=1 Tax=uncultured Desulfobacter sp. TaxID=240139 RepID=UPI0029F5837E|nr:hypothetical protein [uncultured Desulfobacter sp.]